MSDYENAMEIAGMVGRVEDAIAAHGDALTLLALERAVNSLAWTVNDATATRARLAAAVVVERLARRVLTEAGIDADDLPSDAAASVA